MTNPFMAKATKEFELNLDGVELHDFSISADSVGVLYVEHRIGEKFLNAVGKIRDVLENQGFKTGHTSNSPMPCLVVYTLSTSNAKTVGSAIAASLKEMSYRVDVKKLGVES